MANAELAERARMFEERAEKATDSISRQHYREMAAYYRSLSVEHQDGPVECAWVGQAAHSSKGKSNPPPGRARAKGEVEIARARDLSRYPRPISAAFAAGPLHRRSR